MSNQLYFHSTSTKRNGNLSFLYGEKSQVIANRQIFFSQNHLLPTQSIALHTQHGTNIQLVDESFKGRGMFDIETAVCADAVITQRKNLILFLLTADCLPIIFFDKDNWILGIAHLSRENTSLKFVEKIIKYFKEEFTTDPQNLQVHIEPGIHRESYIKDENIFESVDTKIKEEWKPFITPASAGKISIDLVGYNVYQMIQNEILPENIDTSPIDTYTSNDYFSHRRSEVTGEKEGRFATIVGLLN